MKVHHDTHNKTESFYWMGRVYYFIYFLRCLTESDMDYNWVVGLKCFKQRM